MHDIIDSSVWLLSMADSIGDLLSFRVVLFFRIALRCSDTTLGLSKITCECTFRSVLAVILILQSWGGMGVLLAWVFMLYLLLAYGFWKRKIWKGNKPLFWFDSCISSDNWATFFSTDLLILVWAEH